jgi:Dip2/Utp12 Family
LGNLTVGESKRPNAKKMTHQLIQALHGRDANILRNVLRQTDEETVRLTVKYLPSQHVMAFVNEMSLLMTKKTSGSEATLLWLRYLIQTHVHDHVEKLKFKIKYMNLTWLLSLSKLLFSERLSS